VDGSSAKLVKRHRRFHGVRQSQICSSLMQESTTEKTYKVVHATCLILSSSVDICNHFV